MRTDIERIKNGEKPQVLQNAMSVEDIAESMNGASDLGMSNEGIAAYYAVEAQLDAGYRLSEDAIESNLDELVGAGAHFDYNEALNIAKEAASEGWVWDEDREKNLRYNAVEWEMDDELREDLNKEAPWPSNQAFYDAYKRAHLAKFGEMFELS